MICSLFCRRFDVYFENRNTVNKRITIFVLPFKFILILTLISIYILLSRVLEEKTLIEKHSKKQKRKSEEQRLKMNYIQET